MGTMPETPGLSEADAVSHPDAGCISSGNALNAMVWAKAESTLNARVVSADLRGQGLPAFLYTGCGPSTATAFLDPSVDETGRQLPDTNNPFDNDHVLM